MSRPDIADDLLAWADRLRQQSEGNPNYSRDNERLLRDAAAALHVEWICQGCRTTWGTDDLITRIDDGRYCCPGCDQATELVAVPSGVIDAYRSFLMTEAVSSSDPVDNGATP